VPKWKSFKPNQLKTKTKIYKKTSTNYKTTHKNVVSKRKNTENNPVLLNSGTKTHKKWKTKNETHKTVNLQSEKYQTFNESRCHAPSTTPFWEQCWSCCFSPALRSTVPPPCPPTLPKRPPPHRPSPHPHMQRSMTIMVNSYSIHKRKIYKS